MKVPLMEVLATGAVPVVASASRKSVGATCASAGTTRSVTTAEPFSESSVSSHVKAMLRGATGFSGPPGPTGAGDDLSCEQAAASNTTARLRADSERFIV